MADTITLTIAIPTYNRQDCLTECLNSVIAQLCEGVEILVSDNASTDGTGDLVRRMGARTDAIRYHRNETNIGPDGNFLACLREARGKYVHLLSDDDLLLPGGLVRILSLLHANTDLAFLCLNAVWFTGEFRGENRPQPAMPISHDFVTNDMGRAMETMGINVTFVSVLVFHRDTVLSIRDPERFLGTNLLQAHLAVSMFGRSKPVGVLATPVIAARGGNGGGYDLCRVFAYEWKRVLFSTGVRAGIPYGSLQRTFAGTIRTHLRQWTYENKMEKSGYSFRRVDLLLRATAAYPVAWILLYPLVFTPRRILRLLRR